MNGWNCNLVREEKREKDTCAAIEVRDRQRDSLARDVQLVKKERRWEMR